MLLFARAVHSFDVRYTDVACTVLCTVFYNGDERVEYNLHGSVLNIPPINLSLMHK